MMCWLWGIGCAARRPAIRCVASGAPSTALNWVWVKPTPRLFDGAAEARGVPASHPVTMSRAAATVRAASPRAHRSRSERICPPHPHVAITGRPD